EIAHGLSGGDGKFELRAAAAGAFLLNARKDGFKTATLVVAIPEDSSRLKQLVLESERQLTLPITSTRLHPQNGLSQYGTNKYTMTARDIGNLPQGEAAPLNQVLLQMPGVALDQNQEIHIRGEHMGIQYQMNGIMLPLDMNTDPTFTQL